jgi:hypothetical protein
VYGSGESPYRPRSLTEALKAEEEEKALSAFSGYGYAIQQEMNLEIPSTYILDQGDPVTAIVTYADFMEADLIVLNTWWAAKGVSGVLDTWLGNLGTDVIARTLRPVLLVPEKATEVSMKRLVYATSLLKKEQRIPTELKQISHAFQEGLSCVFLCSSGSDYDPAQLAFQREFHRLEFAPIQPNFHTLQSEDDLTSLSDFLEEKQMSLLAMLKYDDHARLLNRLLVPDPTQLMAFRSKIPLLILHQEYNPD